MNRLFAEVPRIARTPTTGSSTTRPLGLGLLALGFAALSAALPLQASAQNMVVDRGTFLLSRNGQAIGTETFTIRRTGSGPNVRTVATGEVRLDFDGREQRMSAALEAAGPEAVITAYQLKEGGSTQSEIYMTLAGRRFQARVVTPGGEQVREYRATPAVIVLEQWVVHHFFFLAGRVTGPTTTVPALIPRTGEQLQLRITDTGTERIQIAGRSVQARRLQIENGGVQRDVWVDGQGRILLVVNSATGFRAERRDLPS